MKFTELSENEQTKLIRESFDMAIEEIAANPASLKNYIKIEKPKLAKIPAKTDSNELVIQELTAANDKVNAEFAEKEALFKKVQEKIVSLPKRDMCFCQLCIDPKALMGFIPDEFEPILDTVREDLASRTF
jgi:hypothetical protein